MPAEADPPRQRYGFKPKEFEAVNAPRPESGEPPAPTPALNDVYALRQELRAREIAAGLDTLAPPARPRANRRRRDYWLLMALINGTLLPLAVWGLRTGNAVLFVYALSGAAFASAAVTWVIWGLMDRY